MVIYNKFIFYQLMICDLEFWVSYWSITNVACKGHTDGTDFTDFGVSYSLHSRNLVNLVDYCRLRRDFREVSLTSCDGFVLISIRMERTGKNYRLLPASDGVFGSEESQS